MAGTVQAIVEDEAARARRGPPALGRVYRRLGIGAARLVILGDAAAEDDASTDMPARLETPLAMLLQALPRGRGIYAMDGRIRHHRQPR